MNKTTITLLRTVSFASEFVSFERLWNPFTNSCKVFKWIVMNVNVSVVDLRFSYILLYFGKPHSSLFFRCRIPFGVARANSATVGQKQAACTLDRSWAYRRATQSHTPTAHKQSTFTCVDMQIPHRKVSTGFQINLLSVRRER